MKKVAVFASGNGSNFEAIAKTKFRNIEVKLLICDCATAYVRERAKVFDIQTHVILPKTYETKEAYEEEILRILKKEAIDLIVLAGYMRFIGPTLLGAYRNQIINIHPSLLPAFKGKQAIKDAFHAKVKYTGVTIHFVDESIDGGQIIIQESVELADKSLSDLEAEIHQVEHRLLPQIIQELLGGES